MNHTVYALRNCHILTYSTWSLPFQLPQTLGVQYTQLKGPGIDVFWWLDIISEKPIAIDELAPTKHLTHRDLVPFHVNISNLHICQTTMKMKLPPTDSKLLFVRIQIF